MPAGVGAGWSNSGNPGSYAFAAPGGLVVNNGGPITGVTTITDIQVSGATVIDPVTHLPVLAQATSLTGAGGGFVRDPLCTQLGGVRTFAFAVVPVVTPTCSTPFNQAENLINQTNRYDLFVDSNFDINDNWRVNASINFSKTVTPHAGAGPGGIGTGGTNAPCDPYDNSIINGGSGLAQNCVEQGAAASQKATMFYASGYNPAVYDFVTKAATNSGVVAGGVPTSGQTTAGTPYFSASQMQTIASCLPLASGLAYTTGSCAVIGSDTPGTVLLNPGLWSPFSNGGVGQNDPLFYDGPN